MSCDREFLKNIDKLSLPYDENNLDRIDVDNRINVTGKNLNIIPKEMLENDRYLYEKLNCIFQTMPELRGTNIGGLIDHINIFKEKIYNIKNNDKSLAQMQIEFLLKNDCNLSIEDAFPCDTVNACDIHAEFPNVHLQYIDKTNYQDCGDCDYLEDC